MRTKWAAVAAVLAIGVGVAAFAAPAPVGKIKPADQWEYGELYYNAGAAWGTSGGAPGPGFPGGPGGPPPGGPMPGDRPGAAREALRWVSGDGEVEAATWEKLAAKLEAPEIKGTAAAQRVRVMNHLGSQGWELVSRHEDAGGISVWVFKRKK